MNSNNNLFKNLFLDFKQQASANPIFACTILLLLTIPMSIWLNNIAIFLLIIATAIYFKKLDFRFDKNLLLPIILYFLMLLSIFWTIDYERTVAALSKELPLLLIPICFLIFKRFSEIQKQKIIQYYSYGIVFLSIYYLANATFRYFETQNSNVFFYHELVTKIVNAIHVSVYVAIAFFYFFTKSTENIIDYLIQIILFVMVLLLSSTNIIIVFIGLIVVYHLFYTKTSKQLRLKNLILVGIVISSLFFINKIKDKLHQEYVTLTTDSTVNDVISKDKNIIYNVSIQQAWNKESFNTNDFFPGTAFRVYQFRIFLEMLQEDNIFWTGYGLNASYANIEQKGIKHNVYLGTNDEEGYQKKNFHNQYVQNFAELGVFGFLILVIMLFINLKNGIVNKNFIHIAFAVLMISLFLTETFLWRQRGVVFFTSMYCLFNAKSLKLDSNN